MSAHIQQAGLLSGRSMTLMVVIGLHALVITALIAARFVPPLIKPAEPRLQWIIEPPPDPLPPEPQPSLATPQLPVVVMPIIDIPNVIVIPVEPVQVVPATEGPSIPAEPVAVVGPVTTAAPVTPAPARAATELQYRMVRPSDDYYPDTSMQLEEQGVAIVRVCVDASGKITGTPTIQTSSGYKRLDRAAVRWASESLRFTPATVDGVGVAACKGFRVNFDLH